MSHSFESAVITVNDFDRICRICLNEENLCPIQCTYITDIKVADLLEYCVMNDIKNERLPQNICEKCLRNLCIVYEFKKQCQDVEVMLKNLLENSKGADVSVENNHCESKITLIDENLIIEVDDDDDVDSLQITTYTGDESEKFDMSRDNVYETLKPDNDDVTKGVHLKSNPTLLNEDFSVDVDDNDDSLQVITFTEHESDELKKSRDNVRKSEDNETLNRNIDITKDTNFESNILVDKNLDKIEFKLIHTISCSKCDYIAADTDDHRRHIDECHNSVKCEVCDKTMPRKFFNYHKKTHTKPHHCDKCPRTFSFSDGLKVHRMTHKGVKRPHVCKICRKDFIRPVGLRKHGERHHPGENYMAARKAFTCIYCGKVFKYFYFFNYHVKKHEFDLGEPRDHVASEARENNGEVQETSNFEEEEECNSPLEDVDDTPEDNIGDKSKEQSVKMNKYRCRECDYETIHRKDLVQHRKESHRFIACELCGKNFIRNYIRNHMRTHTEERPYLCEFCSRRFRRRESLRRHYVTHKEQRERSYMCSSCGKCFFHPVDLKKHEIIMHSDNILSIEPGCYICETCGRTFNAKNDFNAHAVVHRPKSFLCSYCGQRYSKNCLLLAHMRVHTGEKPYTCNICQKTFAHDNNLKTHQRIHTGVRPYECHICSKTFTQKHVIDEHLRTHTGERPFCCTYCYKSFAQRSSFKAHVKLHTGERPHRCRVCGKTFIQSSTLMRHQKTHKKAGKFEKFGTAKQKTDEKGS